MRNNFNVGKLTCVCVDRNWIYKNWLMLTKMMWL